MPPSSQLLDQSVAVDARGQCHAPILGSRSLRWRDEADCAATAQHLAHKLAQRPELRDATIELQGELGAGKTTFVRHLLHALGVRGRVKSPSYAVVESYALPDLTPALNISHFDFYRFHDPREWLDAGFRDIFASPGLKLAEWPEKARAQLPVPDLVLALTIVDEQQRELTMSATSARGLALLA
jgi:tRNA threonylcarbamoyladenosine biosynthesis protein TsaE